MSLTGKHFTAWCRRQNPTPLPPDPQALGLYITACASGAATADRKPNSVTTIERRLSSLSWNYARGGEKLDRKDRAIATVMAGIRHTHAAPPPAEGSRASGRLARHARDPRPRHIAGLARPRHAAHRLYRQPAPL